MTIDLAQLANEGFFPGNLEALQRLRDGLASKRFVAFTGAGTSVPLAPSWTGLLCDLIDQGQSDGFVAIGDAGILRQQVADDPLEVASSLEDAFTKSRFREVLSRKFLLNGHTTECHDAIIRLPIEAIITLNYDDGLSTAFVRNNHVLPNVIRPDDKYDLKRWLTSANNDDPLTIIHWHGVAASPDRMIFTADDYNSFYGIRENSAFVEDVWRNRNLLVVGFGFKDPILTRLAETVLRGAAGLNQHIAIIGRHDDEPLPPLLRRQFAKKYHLDPIFYRITRTSTGGEDHSKLHTILSALHEASKEVKPIAVETTGQVSRHRSPLSDAEAEFTSGLFAGPSGQTLYVEPRLLAMEIDDQSHSVSKFDNAERFVTVEEIVSSTKSFVVSTAMETGSTTLAKRLQVEYLRSNKDVYVRDTPSLPKYKKALLEDKAFRPLEPDAHRVLILDRFDPLSHERTIKEINGLLCYSSVIVLTRSQADEILAVSDSFPGVTLEHLSLSTLRREDIRALASDLYDTFDNDNISAAVEKTYGDLLELCIPLTPLNVIMYLSVVHREGSFTPLNRLQIMERFIRDLLHRPSDIYRDLFNADNKIDVISAFVFELYKSGKSSFDRKVWDEFCTRDMKESLAWFDKDALFEDLANNRVIVEYDGELFFKYKLYYSYFVGKYVAQRPTELPAFLEKGLHLNLDSLVEIIAGISKDNVSLITDLVCRVETAVEDFEQQYKTKDFDPYGGLQWQENAEEEKQLWEPVAKKLSEGPASDSEVDKLKRSIVAESRTSDQSVVIREFGDAQRSVTFNMAMLAGAIRECQRLPAELKMRSMRSLYRSYRIVTQIGFLFAPLIATRRIFVWNNVAFYNAMNFDDYEDASDDEKTAMIAGNLPRAIVGRAADDIGSRRLGSIYSNMIVEGNLGGFESLLTFSLIIRSKPEGWEVSARNLLMSVDREALYLRIMLGSTLRQFNQEVNTNAERAALKRTVAVIQAKRDVRKTLPNMKAIGKALRRLEKSHFFEKNRRAETAPQLNIDDLQDEVTAAVEEEAVQISAPQLRLPTD